MKSLCFIEIDVPDFADSSPEEETTFRFAKPTSYLPASIDCIPSIAALSFTPATISLGQNLGERASLAVSFIDHKHIMNGESYGSGSFFGKWRARYGQRLRGRALRWIVGLEGQTLDEMETRHFVIEAVDGPTPKGVYTIQAKDVLKLADNDRAQAPVISNGFLVEAITDTATTLIMSPAGIGNSEYPASGYAAIGGEEIVAFTRDPLAGNDADTQLLLHCEGADASTTFTDSSANARTPTANGNVQVDTADFKFGLASAIFDGTGDFISFADNAAWTFAGDFSLECWAKFTSLASVRTLICHSTDINNRYRLFVTTGGELSFEVVSASVTTISLISSGAGITTDTWYHLAVSRSGNDFRLFVNGTLNGTTTDADALPNFTSTFKIGISGNGTSDPMLGHIDEVRVSSVARWTASFTAPTTPYETSADLMRITRAQLGTPAEAHDAQDRVQLCLRYEAEDPADIIADLLENYAGVNPDFIPLSSWQNETGAFLQRVYTTTIAEPTGVSKLLSELIEQAALCIWWDDLNQIVRLNVLRPVSTGAATFNEDNTLEGSLNCKDQPGKRISQVWTYFGQRNPLRPVDEPDNYRSSAVTANLEAEDDYGGAVIKKIFSRWIPAFGRSVATKLNDLLLGRYVDPPRSFSFSAFRYGQETPVLGAGFRLESWIFQDMNGDPVDVPIQITRLNPMEDSYQIEAEEMLFDTDNQGDLTNRFIIVDSNVNNFDLREVHDTLYPEVTGTESPEVSITCIVESGVIVGSDDTSQFAFDVGDWPAGIEITLQVEGRIQGAGGAGGSPFGSEEGRPGGGALHTAYPITLEYTSGQIWAGGGGGGGANGSVFGGEDAGGGGGAGTVPGVGGSSGGGTSGSAGTATAGGAAGGFVGGDGGDPGEYGESGFDDKGGNGVAGAPGPAYLNSDLVTVSGTPGDLRGDALDLSGIRIANETNVIPLPLTRETGDLLLIFIAASRADYDDTSDDISFTTPSGWTLLYTGLNGFLRRAACYYRVATGSEGDTVTINMSRFADNIGAVSYAVRDFIGTPEAATATGSSSTPNPPNLTPTWGSQETTWFAVLNSDIKDLLDRNEIPDLPSGYEHQVGTTTVTIGHRTTIAASENPGTFSFSGGTHLVATVGVRRS